MNSYGFVENDVVTGVDYVGLAPIFDSARKAFEEAALAAVRKVKDEGYPKKVPAGTEVTIFSYSGVLLYHGEVNIDLMAQAEACGLVCCRVQGDGDNRLQFTYSEPVITSPPLFEVSPFGGSISPRLGCSASKSPCPDGWTRVGTYHSQPDTEVPSLTDWRAAWRDAIANGTAPFFTPAGPAPEPFSVGSDEGNVFVWPF